MKSRLRKRSMHPTLPMHIFSILSEIWNSLPDEYFNNPVCLMPKRSRWYAMEQVIQPGMECIDIVRFVYKI